MKIFTRLLAVAFLLLLSIVTRAQLVITPETSALALAQKLVGNGVSISNVSFTGDFLMAGHFRNFGNTNINLDSGIVLTNGHAKTGSNAGLDWPGTAPAGSILADNGLGLRGDIDLANEVGVPVTQTNDANVLEFDIVPLGDTIKFRYVFSSEEYVVPYVCQFNDAFAFFISGPGIVGFPNIALIPNTTIPVTIFNVNDVVGSSCVNNPQYFIDNNPNTWFTHDGHTVVFTAVARVQPCQTYHLKLVIADLVDDAFDSGVFLEAKSLSSNVVDIANVTQTDGQGNDYLVEGCVPGSFTIARPQADPSPLIISLAYGGTAVNGVDVQPLPLQVTIPANQTSVSVNVVPIVDGTPEGIENLIIYALGGCAGGLPSDSSIIQIRDYDTLGIIPDTAVICRRSSIQLTATNTYNTYQWDPNPTLSSTTINNPMATPVNNATTYYATGTSGSCNGRDSAYVRMKMLTFISKQDVNCRNGTTGEIRVTGGTDWDRPAEFTLDNNPWQADSTFTNLPVGTYWVKIRDALNCIDSIQVTIVQAFPDLLITAAPVEAATCSGLPDGKITVTGTGGNAVYTYSIDGINFQSSNVFNVIPGNYTVTLMDGNNCTDTYDVVVPLNNTVTLDAGANTTICEGKSWKMNPISNGTSYAWTPTATLDNPAIMQPVASPVVTTQYYVTATTGVCTRVDSMIIFVNPAPTANAGTDRTICNGTSTQLSGSGGILFKWSPPFFLDNPDIYNPTSVNPTHTVKYYLNVADANGCVSLQRDSVIVTVVPPAKLFVGNDTSIAINQPLQLFARDMNGSGFTDYTWSPSYGLTNPFSGSPVAVLDRDITYYVTASTPNGCTGKDTINIKVYKGPDIYVPNAFSPNGDNLNDVLHPIPIGMRTFNYFRLFNRWGEMIFETRDARRGWDGKVKGAYQATGTSFVWIAEAIDYNGNTVQRKGVVIIVR